MISVNSAPQETSLQTALRFFNGLGSSIVGSDQNYVGDDGRPTGTAPSVFSITNPSGLTSTVGQPQSNVAVVAPSPLPTMLLVAGAGVAIWWFVRRRKKG